MKKITYPILLSFLMSYMLFVYEPIVMFANNKKEFWFDIYTMLPSLIIIVLSLCAIASLFYFFIYKTNKKLCNIIVIIHFIIMVILYIHGNFFASKLNILDGTNFILEKHYIDILISIFIIFIIASLTMISIKKNSIDKTIKISKYISLTIFIMLTSGLVYTLIETPKVLDKREHSILATNKNITSYSSKTNFIIFLIDGADSRVFDKARINSKYKDIFTDFTYYPDTMAPYGNTSNSVPFLFSGIWDEKKESYEKYSKKAYKKSPLLNLLKKNNYEINLYETEFIMEYESALNIANFSYKKRRMNPFLFFKQELKYISFKYLPYFLKQYSNINSFKLSAENLGAMNNSIDEYGFYDWDNIINYDYITRSEFKKKKSKEFKFFHIEGPHLPFNMDENLNIISDGTYEKKSKATLKILDEYLKKLKENNIYNNSIIIFVADHGLSEDENFRGRQNPILYIKGIDEHHKFKISDKPISFLDLIDSYQELMKGKKSDELFANIKQPRKRRYLYYPDQFSNTLIEYYQTGKAWDWNTMVETGNIYKLKEENNNAN